MKQRRVEFFLMLAVLLIVNFFTLLWLQGRPFAAVWANGLAAPATAPLAATIPRTFSYQGTLRDANGSLINVPVNLTLKLYAVVTGGNALHTESFPNVNVRAGLFSVVVGDATPIAPTVFDNVPLYLGLSVNQDAEMLPRQRLHPVPYAMQASSAQTAVTANNLVQGGGVPNLVTLGTGGAKQIGFPGGGTITDSPTGMTIIGGGNKVTTNGALDVGGAVAVGGDLSVAGNWSTTAVREIGDSNGGSVRADYPVSLKRYVVEAKDAGGGFDSVPVDDTLLVQLCADEDGCSFRIGFRDSVDTNNAVVLGGPFNFTIGQTKQDGTRIWYVINDGNNPGDNTLNTDKGGGTNHAKTFFDCYLTDGTFINGADQGDTELGFALLNANNSSKSINHVCVLIIED